MIDAVLSGQPDELEALSLGDLRLGVPRGYFATGVSMEYEQAFNELLTSLAAAGVTLVEAELPDAEITDDALYPILFGETREAVTQFLAEWGGGVSFAQLHEGLGWDVKAMWDQLVVDGAPERIPHEVYQQAINVQRPRLQAAYKRYFLVHRVDAILFPATAHTAPLATPENPQEADIDGEQVSIFVHDHNSSPGALAGQPGVVIPLRMSNAGLPFGLSLDGPAGGDRRLLAVARAIDQILAPIPAPGIVRR